MFIEQMRSYIRSVVEIDSSDIDDATLNRFLGEGYDQIVYSEKRWSFYEVSTTLYCALNYPSNTFYTYSFTSPPVLRLFDSSSEIFQLVHPLHLLQV